MLEKTVLNEPHLLSEGHNYRKMEEGRAVTNTGMPLHSFSQYLFRDNQPQCFTHPESA